MLTPYGEYESTVSQDYNQCPTICPQSDSLICLRQWLLPPPPSQALSSNACNFPGYSQEARGTQQNLHVKK